ncbi:DUF4405 domain-containing protein [Herpetosiphon gulosus]|uniref:Flavinylation-associated cytochrome domain-containing protein n=1 Tax=Herpetosiphon gulosus TaxID=1973496 RepID=A0ABP9WYB7_9CHLR
MQTATTIKKGNRTKTNYVVDLVIGISFLIATAPNTTGEPIHEWLSMGLAVMVVTHLLLHWQWIVAITKKIFRKVAWQQRINYILNIGLFIDMTIIMFTGIMISKTVVPLLGLELPNSMTWRSLHGLASDAGVFLIGLHLALHWDWIVRTSKRYLIQPITKRFHKPAVQLATKEQ